MKIRTLLLNGVLVVALCSAPFSLAANEATDPDRVYGVQELDARPEVVKVRPPRYPAELSGSGQSGLVAITLVIDRSGDIESIEVTKASAPAFGQAAMECVRGWKFSPATVKGQSVRARISLPVRFEADVTTVAKN